jgi:hypothetical protein
MMPPRVDAPNARRLRQPTPEPYPQPNKALLGDADAIADDIAALLPVRR